MDATSAPHRRSPIERWAITAREFAIATRRSIRIWSLPSSAPSVYAFDKRVKDRTFANKHFMHGRHPRQYSRIPFALTFDQSSDAKVNENPRA